MAHGQDIDYVLEVGVYSLALSLNVFHRYIILCLWFRFGLHVANSAWVNAIELW